MGELGILFSLAKATFIGGSFKQGGHSIIEPAYFNTVIVFGPDMTNCSEVADEFLAYRAAHQIENTKELEEILEKVYSGQVLPSKKRCELIIENHADIIRVYIEYIDKYLERND
jgi:3-deoxy-D-manno-octulosonic-acid transferase